MRFFYLNQKEETIFIEEVKCENCIFRFQEELKKCQVKIEMTLNEKFAKVSFDERKISFLEIKDKINALGYSCV